MLLFILLPIVSNAAASSSKVFFEIDKGALSSVLNTFAEQAELQLVVNYNNVRDLSSEGLSGEWSLQQALKKLLNQSGLDFRFINHTTVAIYALAKERQASTASAPKSSLSQGELGANANMLEVIVVSARRIPEKWQDVPISLAVLNEEQVRTRFQAADPVAAFSLSVPSLYAESSNGRTAPRFYLRGLGNADFNQGASQPVSLVYDNIPLEKSGVRSFPIFDIQAIEVLRGPQGSLFGKNTSAGTVLIHTQKPNQLQQGYMNVVVGELNTVNLEGAVNQVIVKDELTSRIALYSHSRSNYINNGFSKQTDVIGGYHDFALRNHILWEPNEQFSALLTGQYRHLDGHSSTPFRANSLSKGSNELNHNFVRNQVFYDGGGDQPSTIEHGSVSLSLTHTGEQFTTTILSSLHSLNRFGRADIDGGYGVFNHTQSSGPGAIPAAVDTGSDSDIQQVSHELRVTGDITDKLDWQAGFFYFADEFDFFDLNANEYSQVIKDIGVLSRTNINNQSYAAFFHHTYHFSDTLRISGGLRFTTDKKQAIA